MTVRILSRCFKDNKILAGMKTKVKADELNAVVLEGYLEFLITGVINMNYPTFSTVREMIPFGFGCISLSMAIFWMPLGLLYVLTRNSIIYEDHDFERSWGSFYEGIRRLNKLTLMFNFFFMLRRVLLVYAVFWLNDYVVF